MQKILDETVFMDLVSVDSDLSYPEIESLRNIFDRVEILEDAGIGGGGTSKFVKDENIRRSKVFWLNAFTIPEFKLESIHEKIISKVDEVNEKFFKFDLLEVEDLQLTKYDSSEEGFYKLHTDCNNTSRNLVRKLSFVLQLSDDDEFDGGDFVCMRGAEEIKVSENKDFIKKGKIIFFPSFMPHGITPVIRGTRYSLVGWCIGPRFK